MLFIFNQSRWLLAIFIALFTSLAFGHGMSDAEKQIIIEGGNLRYIWIGASHMLSGYDHLAFVFGIIFFLSKFKDVVKYITAFTVGHSITLILATFNAVQVNYFIIDAIIALSVCYIAFNNIGGFKQYLNIAAPNMMAMIFSLGLVHGLGLSTRLQQLPLNPDNLLMNIVSFNIGIELGQIMALSVMLLLMAVIRKRDFFTAFSRVSNTFLILAGALLFIMQMHSYEHAAHADALNTHTETSPQDISNQNTQPHTWQDTIKVTIPANGDKEYKVMAAKGARFEYTWATNTGDLFFDFHGEPKGDTTGYFKSFKKGTNAQYNGTLTTLFEGTHGWYWSNSSAHPIIVTLKIAGQYQRIDLHVTDNQIPAPKTVKKSVHDTIF